jgi:hypothetical protein
MCCGLDWPPNFDHAPEIKLDKMAVRVAEICFFLHKAFNTASKYPPKTCQFADANHNLKRLVGWNEDEKKFSCTDPWKPLVPGLTCRSQILCRFTNSHGAVDKIRLITGQELMLMIGYPESNAGLLHQHTHKETTDFAGAAFSGFAVVPVFTAALFGAGLAGLTGDPDQELSTVSHPEVHQSAGESSSGGPGTSKPSRARTKAKTAPKPELVPKAVTCDDLAGSSSHGDSSSDED